MKYKAGCLAAAVLLILGGIVFSAAPCAPAGMELSGTAQYITEDNLLVSVILAAVDDDGDGTDRFLHTTQFRPFIRIENTLRCNTAELFCHQPELAYACVHNRYKKSVVLTQTVS